MPVSGDVIVETEKSTLGAILVNNGLFDSVSTILRAEDFFRDAHQKIWRAIVRVQATSAPIDLVTLCAALSRTGELDKVGGIAYIAALPDGVPKSTNAPHYARIIREAAALRRLRRLVSSNGGVAVIIRAARELEGLGNTPAADDPSVWMPKPVSLLRANLNNVPDTVARGLFYEGRLTCIHSPKKRGKSTILAAAVAAITTEEPFLDEPTKHGRVLWIGEESVDDIAGRHRQFLGDPDELFVTDARQAVRYAPAPTRVERLKHMIEAVEPDVLVCDTLTHLGRLLGVKSMSQSVDAHELVDVLQTFARDGMAVAFTHHQPRNSDGTQYEPRMRDSTAFEGAVDAEIAFRRSGREVTLTCTGARWRLPTHVAELDPEQSGFALLEVRDDDGAGRRLEETRDWRGEIEDIIRKHSDAAWTMTKLRQALRVGRSYDALRRAVNAMVDAGSLETYKCTVRGKERECFRFASPGVLGESPTAECEREPGDEDPADLHDTPDEE